MHIHAMNESMEVSQIQVTLQKVGTRVKFARVRVFTITSIGHYARTLMSKTALQAGICLLAMPRNTVVRLSTVFIESTSTVFLGTSSGPAQLVCKAVLLIIRNMCVCSQLQASVTLSEH